MAIIKILRDKLGEIIYPQTKMAAVYDDNGSRLDTELGRAVYFTVVNEKVKFKGRTGYDLGISFVTDEELDSKGYVLADDADLTETESGELATVEYIEQQNYVSENEMKAAIQTAITGALEALY